MVKQKLINFIKTHGLFYDIYYYIGSMILRFIGLFLRIDDRSILFVSFGGKKFNDSPKALYDYISQDESFNNYKLIWAFNDPDKYNIGKGKKIRIDSFKFFITALRTRYWISNSAIERGLNFKKKSTFYINTWHGTPLKRIGTDAISSSTSSGLGSKNIYTQDLMTAQSEFDAKIFSRLFKIDINNILICDLPRNDFLTSYKKSIIPQIKEKLGINKCKKVILYAPTYREYLRDQDNSCYIASPIDTDKWKEKLGNEYVVLFRAHYEIAKAVDLDNSQFINVSDYENLNELMIVSDILISDYSSIFFDYSILERPMLCFAYDFKEYSIKRGLYLNLDEELPCEICLDEENLLKSITTMDYEYASINTKNFKNKYIRKTGESCKTIVDRIIEMDDR